MRYTSFVIRLWLPGDDRAPDNYGYRGQVEHVQSGTTARVSSLEDIQGFMRQWLTNSLPVNDRREYEDSHKA